MRQRTLFAILLVFGFAAFNQVVANPITRQQARKNVQAFLEKKGKKMSSLMYDATPGTADNESYYIFNVGNNQGYVVASGDDCAPGILGYSSKGALIQESIPDNMEAWLQGYADQIAYMRDKGHSYKGTTTSDHAAISPLMTTTWGQNEPYNLKCPDFFSYGKSVTGCVATAMAQVMYYHRATSTNQTLAEIPAYQCDTEWLGDGQIAVDAIPAGSKIDWDNMIDRYLGVASTEVQQTAVANLMAYCGASVMMDYSTGGSGALSASVPGALKKYFGYSKDTYLEKRANYTDEEWDNLIYNELSKGNPVYYSGSNSSGGGHAFVCDGYDGDGYYHINWGWDGKLDGNFLLSALDPDIQGTGGSDDGFVFDQDALIDAVPRDLTVPEYEAYAVFDNGILTFYCDNDRASKAGTTYDLNSGYDYPTWNYEYDAETNSYDGSKAVSIAKVVFDPSFSSATPTTTSKWFSACVNLTEIEGMEYLNTKYVENMADMFSFCLNLSSFDLSTFDTGRVGDFQNMFIYCWGIKKLDISHFVTRKAQTMYHMFRDCSNLAEIILPGDIKFISESLFQRCGSLTSITIPASVTAIGKEAFMDSGLKTVYSFMKTPCSFGENAFSGISSDAILYVPAASKEAYVSAGYGNWFKEIVETYSLGDVNGDGAVDIADAVCIVNHIVGKPTLIFIDAVADVNHDDAVDIADAVCIVNLIVGKINALARQRQSMEPEAE